MAITVRRLGYALGAAVTGVDLREKIDAKTHAEIQAAWNEHIVLCFPRQDLSPKQLLAFAANFGEIDDNRRSPHDRHPGYDDIILLSNKPVEIDGKQAGGTRNGRAWHADFSYAVRPSTGSFLNAKELPGVGGDTAFASMYAAYDALSPAMQAILDPLWAVHDVSLASNFASRDAESQARSRRLNPPVAHPLVHAHPETGRKALHLGYRIRRFMGMTDEESRPLVEFLNDHAVAPERVYRHSWTVNDLVMWDNRCAMHLAVQDYDNTGLRKMIRCALLGPKTGRLEDEFDAAQTDATELAGEAALAGTML